MAKKHENMRGRFIAEMDELALNIAGAVKRMPSTLLTEKVDAFKALTQYANTINKTPVSEEGNAIDQFREALGVATGADSAARRGDSRSGAGDNPDNDGDGDDESESDDDAEFADADADADVAQPASRVPSSGDGSVRSANGLAVGGFSRSVRLPDDQ